MQFEKSADTRILESVLAEAKVGEIVSYDKLSAAIGRDVRQHSVAALRSARQGVFKEHKIVFGVERNVGYKRLDDNGIVSASEADRLKIQRHANRAVRKLQVVDFANLDDEAKRQHLASSAAMGAVALFSSKKAAKRLSNVQTNSEVLSIGETLKMFSS